MLDILDYPKQKLISDADFWQFAQTHLGDAKEFQAVSFVSSINFIEKELLPRFEKVTLVLGLSDDGAHPIGNRLSLNRSD